MQGNGVARAREFPDGQSVQDAYDAAHAHARAFSGIAFSDMRVRIESSYVVKALIAPDTLVVIVGPSGSGKTFFATDLAVHVAANRPWRGHKVAGGLVVYAALEGGASAAHRFCATRDLLKFDAGIPLVMTPDSVSLRDPRDVEAFIEFVRAQESAHGTKASMVFVDTLSRAMAGGDENGSEDMGALIAGADRLRLATGAAICLIHHTGKDESRGARGWSGLRAALDTEIEVSTSGSVHVASVTKQRDLPTGGAYAFTLDVVELGRDTEDDPITTCVVRPADAPVAARKVPTGKNQAALLAALQEWQRVHAGHSHISSIDLRAIAKTQGIAGKRLAETIEPLQRLGWLLPAVGGYTLNQDSEP